MRLVSRPAPRWFRRRWKLTAWNSASVTSWLTLAVAVVLATACSDLGPKSVPSEAHPVVLIAIDGLRADHLGCYGYERDTSPNIDALARESIVFEWAFSQASEPLPSLASIWTGLYPSTHKVRDPGDTLRGEAATLAELLAGHGTVTGAFLAGGSAAAGLGQGFELIDVGGSAEREELTSKVSAWLEDHASKGFLLAVQLSDLGPPFLANPTYGETFASRLAPPSSHFRTSLESGGIESLGPDDLEYAKALYDAQIRRLDDWVGEFMVNVRQLGLDRRATIVLVATHGREFQEHGAASNEALYTPSTRVPLLLRLPGGREARSIAQFVETLDVMPTLLELTGVDEPATLQGNSLVPLLLGRGKPPYVAFGESSRESARRFVALGGYRMLFSRENDTAELYRLLDDPLERNDLAGDEAEAKRLAALRRHLEAWEKMVTTASLDPDQPAAPMDEQTLEQLRSLGYIQ